MYTSSLSLALFSFLSGTSLAQSNATPSPPPRNFTTAKLQIAPDATQQVSYFIAQGLAIIHGDVIYSTEDELHQKLEAQKRSLSILESPSEMGLWPAGRIDYKWQSEQSNLSSWREDWTWAMKMWTDMLPFLQFIEHPANYTLMSDIVTLVPTTGQRACYSTIGKTSSASANKIMLDDDCGEAAAYAHEIGHLLGLYHEHQRPDRDDYITLNCSNVIDSPPGTPADCSQDNCRGWGCQFTELNANAANWSGPYDSLSIMHYGPFNAAKSWAAPVFTEKPGVPRTPDYYFKPTVLDATRVCDLYSKECTGICGNGVLEPGNGEGCDDGNNFDGDGCSSACKREGTAPPSSSASSLPPPSSTPSLPPPSSTPTTPTPPTSTPNPSPSSPPSTCPIPTCGLGAVSGCDTTTTCTILGGATLTGKGQHLCACRAGYRASGHGADDGTVQVRLPWAEQSGRVFVAPGVVCDQLCDEYWLGMGACGEVEESAVCY